MTLVAYVIVVVIVGTCGGADERVVSVFVRKQEANTVLCVSVHNDVCMNSYVVKIRCV